jgi:hypothetical protein
MGKPVPTAGPDGGLTVASVTNLTTTRQSMAYPSGAKWVSLAYRLLPGATATANQFAKVVFNAASDADADGKLALSGAHIPLFQGDDLSFDSASITRIDVIAAAAVGTEVTRLRILAGV